MAMWFTKFFRQLSGFIESFSQPVPSPTPGDAELGGTTFEEAMNSPQNYFGYAEFSKFLAAAPNFPMVRRFDRLGVRAILHLQEELRTIEQLIDHIDDEMMKPDGQANNATLRQDPSEERQRLIWRAYTKLDRHYRFVHLYAQLRDWPSPTDRDLRNVRGWVNTKTLWEWQSGPLALERLDEVVTGLIGLAMLIAPLWIIGLLPTYHSKVGVITCFIFLCLLLVCAGTNAKPAEALGVTAGYAAVLIVVLQVKKGDA